MKKIFTGIFFGAIVVGVIFVCTVACFSIFNNVSFSNQLALWFGGAGVSG